MICGGDVIQFDYKAEKAKKQSKPEKKTSRERKRRESFPQTIKAR
jgi:hypothetical protein